MLSCVLCTQDYPKHTYLFAHILKLQSTCLYYGDQEVLGHPVLGGQTLLLHTYSTVNVVNLGQEVRYWGGKLMEKGFCRIPSSGQLPWLVKSQMRMSQRLHWYSSHQDCKQCGLHVEGCVPSSGLSVYMTEVQAYW